MDLTYTSLMSYANAKTIKGEPLGYLTAVMYLAPEKQSVEHGGRNTCPFATKGCASACLYKAGRGRFTPIQSARLARTLAFFADRNQFLGELTGEIYKLQRLAKKREMKPCVRLNGTSDIGFHRMGIIDQFPHLQFYDYTKNPDLALEFARGELAPNYHVTFSRSEENHDDCMKVLSEGGNVAVVFDIKKGSPLPSSFMGVPVIDADQHDLRFLDGKGIVAGLRIKGDRAMKAQARESGFAVNPAESEYNVKVEKLAA